MAYLTMFSVAEFMSCSFER